MASKADRMNVCCFAFSDGGVSLSIPVSADTY